MIYLALFNASVLHATMSPLGLRRKVGRRRQERGSREDDRDWTRREEAAAPCQDFLQVSGQSFRRTSIFCPQHVHVCQKKAALICWLINKLPLTNDRRPSSYKQYLHGRCVILLPTSLPFLQTMWAGTSMEAPQVRGLSFQDWTWGSRATTLPSLPILACPHGTD